MRKSLFLTTSMLFLLAISSMATATSKPTPKIFTEIIKNTDVKTVQETVYAVFTEAGFSPVGMFPDRIVMNKGFGDGYILAYVARTSSFITLQNGKDVVMSVTQKELVNGIIPRETSIVFILPMIKSVKTKIDGTPAAQIKDETQYLDDLRSGKELGLTLADKNAEGQYSIVVNELSSALKKSKLQTGDAIINVDFSPISGMDKQEAEDFINNKWRGCKYLIIEMIRDGKPDLVKLRKDQ